MRLVASLQDAGLCVWTPTEHLQRRLPRTKAKTHVVVPMAPTYAFAREEHLPELLRLMRMEVSPHPRFSIFRHNGGNMFVRHTELHRLRARQQASYLTSLPPGKKRGKPLGAAFDVGETVTFKSGPLAGLECQVETSDGRNTTLLLSLFGRKSVVSAETLQLRSPDVLNP